MYGGPTLASSPKPGLSAMDVAASQQQQKQNDRGYYRQGGPNMNRPGTTASQTTTPYTNRSNTNLQTGINDNSNNGTDGRKTSGVSATGLIRLTLKKPMGIVFEPMEDPHNPSQQRGVRICDLPRTGAAAMSGRLEVGDELLSINNKTMSRLTFDEIMDFIIEADAENVILLFRRPKKEGRSAAASDSSKQRSNVKWVDNAKDSGKRVVTEVIEPEPKQDEATIDDDETLSTRSPSPLKSKGKRIGNEKKISKRAVRDEESIVSADDTFYTETTEYTEETRQKKRRGRRNRKFESETFLDMLIDSLCAPVMGEMGRKGDYSDDDETYTSGADDETYGTYESSYDERRRKWNERKRRDREMSEKSKKEKKNESSRKSKKTDVDIGDSYESKPFQPRILDDGYAPQDNKIHDNMNLGSNSQNPPPPPPPPPTSNGNNSNDFQINQQLGMNSITMNINHMNNGMHNMNNINMKMNNMGLESQNHFMPSLGQAKDTNADSVITDPNLPIKELEYDDDVDHAAEVSVMDSIGGPSLLLENLRNASRIVKTVSPEIIQKFGASYPQDLGLTREESIQVDPNKFYRWVVKNLLEAHEPEKVRLIDKLFEKYKGREEHLIHKLNARYTDDEEKSKRSGAIKRDSTSEDGDDYDGFVSFSRGGGDFSKSMSSSKDQSNYAFGKDGWPATIGEEGEEEDSVGGEEEGKSFDESEDYSDADYESVDGTSPEVIAQVSELLNYVYGKTSVPGQIDRVSTIMRAYEGRTGVLLELLETKALLKANADTENGEDIPDCLKSKPGLQIQNESMDQKHEIKINESADDKPVLSPISNFTGGSGRRNEKIDSGTKMHERHERFERNGKGSYDENGFDNDYENEPVVDADGDTNNLSAAAQTLQPSFNNPSLENPPVEPSYSPQKEKKKKKGFFGMFKKKKGKKDAGGAFPVSDGGFKKNHKRGMLLG